MSRAIRPLSLRAASCRRHDDAPHPPRISLRLLLRLGRVAVPLVAILLSSVWSLVHAQDASAFEGHWIGSIQLPGQELEFDLDLERNGGVWAGDITIPAQGAVDLPLEGISIEGATAVFSIAGISGAPTFEGSFAAETPSSGGTVGEGSSLMFSGEFSQGGQSFPFTARSGEDPVTVARGALEGLGEVIEAALADWKTPGLALAVVKGDELLLLEGFGRRDVEADLPITPKTLFPIGSTTKAFTTFALATLVDEGILDWDTPVIEYIPGFQLYDEYATLHLTPRDMVTHRSGLPRHDLVWYNDEKATREDLVRRLRYLQPNKELREVWQYNNLMYLTAGYLTEVLTGQTWEDAVRERVLDPLGMTQTNFSVLESRETDDFAQPYLLDDTELRRVEFRPLSVVGSAGSINSSVAEMARWVRVHLNGGTLDSKQLLSRGTLRELHTPQMVLANLPDEPGLSPSSYAFGWFVESWHGHLMVHHGGNIDGFTARVTLFPSDDLGIVALSNRNADSLPALLSFEIANRIFEVDDEDRIGEAAARRDEMQQFAREGERQQDMFRKKGTKTSRPFADFAGDYFHPGYGTVEIRPEGQGLVMVHNGMEMPLEHWHYDVFTVPESDEEMIPAHFRIVFQLNAEGRVSGLSVPFEPTIDPLFFERQPDRRLSDPDFLSRFAGEYDVPGEQVLVVSLQGGVLVGRVSDQPPVEMIPEVLDPNGAEFTIEEVKGISFRFEFGPSGEVARVLLVQPGGVFELPRRQVEAK